MREGLYKALTSSSRKGVTAVPALIYLAEWARFNLKIKAVSTKSSCETYRLGELT